VPAPRAGVLDGDHEAEELHVVDGPTAQSGKGGEWGASVATTHSTDAACPNSTGWWTRRVQSERGEGRSVSTQYESWARGTPRAVRIHIVDEVLPRPGLPPRAARARQRAGGGRAACRVRVAGCGHGTKRCFSLPRGRPAPGFKRFARAAGRWDGARGAGQACAVRLMSRAAKMSVTLAVLISPLLRASCESSRTKWTLVLSGQLAFMDSLPRNTQRCRQTRVQPPPHPPHPLPY